MAKKTCSNPTPAVAMSREQAKREREWRAEDDLRTLQRAAEIQGDTSRVRAAQQVAKRQMAALSKVAGRGNSRSKR